MSLPQLEGFREFVEKTRVDWKVPGIAVAIVNDGEVIFCEGFGQRNVEKDLPVTPDTIFAIGSSTKAFAAMSVALMVDDGKLEWDKPVSTYIPNFKLHDALASERMSPRDLLCHRSGLPRHDMMWYGSSFTREEMIDRFHHLIPSKDFRTNFQYQNLMYMTAGYLAGKVAGTEWETVVRQRIFEPLGMSNSNFSVDESQTTADYALPYQEKDEKVDLIPFRNITTVGPAGSIDSNLKDMVKWVQLQLNKGKYGDLQVISEASLKEMHKPQMTIDDPMWAERFGGDYIMYGLGWFIQPYRGHTLIHHGGNIDGFSAFVSFMPDINAGAVILTNLNSNVSTMSTAFNIYDRLLGLEPLDWNAKFKEFVDKQKEAMNKAKEQSASDCKEGTQPSHSLDGYLGDYEHPAYGVVSVTRDGNQLYASFNTMTWTLEHYHYDIFDAVLTNVDLRLKITFLTDVKGNIGSFTLQLEPMVKESVFTRMPDKSMQNKGFLEQFTGEYDVMGMTMTISLKGEEALIASVPGQGDQELVPYLGTTFNLKELTGFSIEFKKDDRGNVVEALITQPTGSFAAKKKA